MPTTAFTILASVTGSTPVGPTVTGWTDPIVVPTAIAARYVDSKRIVPALNAWAPVGPTHPRIGTVIALSMSLAMSSVACSSPPGVSNRRISASYPPVRASSIASLMYSTVERSIAPVTSARSTRGPCARVEGIAMSTSVVKRTISRSARAGLPHLLRGLEFALRHDHPRPAFPFRLRLLGDRPHHRVRERHIPQGDRGHLDPPRLGRVVEEDLDPLAQVLALREELVELDLAEDVPQSGLGEQIRRLDVVLDLGDGLERIVHAVVDHRVDLDGHVVSAHDALTRHIEGDEPQVDEDPTVEDRDDHRQAGSLRLAQEATEPEDHEPFVFPNHLDRP